MVVGVAVDGDVWEGEDDLGMGDDLNLFTDPRVEVPNPGLPSICLSRLLGAGAHVPGASAGRGRQRERAVRLQYQIGNGQDDITVEGVWVWVCVCLFCF